MKTLSKLEILEETIEYYSKNERATNNEGGCDYLSKDGRMCAFSRCCSNPAELDKQRGTDYIDSFKDEINEYLKPEYRGHEWRFWRSIQSLHDNKENWHGRRITKAGLKKVEEIKKEYSL